MANKSQRRVDISTAHRPVPAWRQDDVVGKLKGRPGGCSGPKGGKPGERQKLVSLGGGGGAGRDPPEAPNGKAEKGVSESSRNPRVRRRL